MDWVELFGSSQYDFPLEVETGSTFVGGENYPDAIVTASDLLYPRRILIQRLDLAAEDRSADRKERIRVYRVAIETEDGDLVELRRIAVPGAEISNIDVSKCAGCSGKIPEGQHVAIDGLAYHKRCVCAEVYDGSASNNSGDGDGSTASDGTGDSSSEMQIKEGEAARDGASPETAPTTVTRQGSDDGISVSHLVTVTKLDDDRDIVTLWSREHGSRSGTVQGRWSSGLFHGDLPTKTDTDYIDRKFFKGAEVVAATDLRVWNKLYKDALQELRPPFR